MWLAAVAEVVSDAAEAARCDMLACAHAAEEMHGVLLPAVEAAMEAEAHMRQLCYGHAAADVRGGGPAVASKAPRCSASSSGGAGAAARGQAAVLAGAASDDSDSCDDDPTDRMADWLSRADGGEVLGWLRRSGHM